MEKIIITTTNSIEGATVEKYLGVVTSNLVIGTNFFSDFIADFSDLFGGMSGTYRKQMDTLYKRANDDIVKKATERGANCILGFKIDFDEISGKGKSMFMVSVSGTAVRLKQDGNEKQSKDRQRISDEAVEIELFKRRWKNRDEKELPTDEEWDFILKYNLTELAPDLYKYYNKALWASENIECQRTVDNFRQMIAEMDYEQACDVLYENYPARKDIATPLIKRNKLFNPEKVYTLIKADIFPAIDLLAAEKEEYTEDDIQTMGKIVSLFDVLPDKGSIKEVKSLMTAKIQEMYICPNGHKNDKDRQFCTQCGANIKGLDKAQAKTIESFKTKVEILNKLISK